MSTGIYSTVLGQYSGGLPDQPANLRDLEDKILLRDQPIPLYFAHSGLKQSLFDQRCLL